MLKGGWQIAPWQEEERRRKKKSHHSYPSSLHHCNEQDKALRIVQVAAGVTTSPVLAATLAGLAI